MYRAMTSLATANQMCTCSSYKAKTSVVHVCQQGAGVYICVQNMTSYVFILVHVHVHV